MKAPGWHATPAWARPHLEAVGDRSTRDRIYDGLAALRAESPVVTVVIPARNEARSLLATLSSFAAMKPRRPTELLFVDNGSSDATAELAADAGLTVIHEERPGPGRARQTGMELAVGRILLTADADALYPPGWIDGMADALDQPGVSCVWGPHAYLGDTAIAWQRTRLADAAASLRAFRRPHLNVLGMSAGFHVGQVRAVGGFRVEVRRGEDGCLAAAVRRFGAIRRVSDPELRVWTLDRVEAADGARAISRRLRKELPRIPEYLGLRDATPEVRMCLT